MSIYTVTSGLVGILSTAGKFDKDEVPAGLHFKIPFYQKVIQFDTKMHTVNYLTMEDMPDGNGVVNKPRISVLDKKNLTIWIELTVQYTPIASEASEIMSSYGVSYFTKLVNPVIRDVVRDVVGQYEAEKIAIDRATIATRFKVLLDKKFQGSPIMIGEVSLRDIILPKVVTRKIEDVQIAKQKEQELEMVERQALRNQKIETTKAETELIKLTTDAKAKAEAIKLASDADAYKIRVVAEARAKANKKIAESITQKLIDYNHVQTWDGAYPTTYMSGEGKELIYNLPSKE